ncbi:MAG: bifunctional 5,10-methylenetetrahydrofolate dehydrogenase/5,10-methenyltetrahydrofolate cyclohydrolase [Planctomycetes bacterium]|nr:bifunctional 5,10-methylenetetrahydrofolate dehydrogenase/5,10-methenyltetrahydrofolate cyclohydrolase [Planctomycetota bacterium]
MGARILSGEPVAARIRDALRAEIQAIGAAGIPVRLVSLQVGDDPATAVYAQRQQKVFEELGIPYERRALPAETSEDDLLATIGGLNADPRVTGIILGLPLPKGMSAARVQQRIDPVKDAEGIHPQNIGNLLYGRTGVGPPTALAVLELIRASGCAVEGAEAVIVGHSDIVGKPVTFGLLRQLATTTTCHIATRDLASHTRRADILVVAVGKPGFIAADMVKEGAVIIDVGINRILIGRRPVFVGDVAFDAVVEKAGWITPVPGGVGPVTVLMLARNTLISAREQARGRGN